MGVGASASVAELQQQLAKASDAELKEALSGLSDDHKAKLKNGISQAATVNAACAPVAAKGEATASTALGPGCILVETVDIKADRVDDFLKAMQMDVTQSRDKELDPGCLRFDLLRDRVERESFTLMQYFVDEEAAARHKTTAHYKAWADFEASGGVSAAPRVTNLEATSLPKWAFQAQPSGEKLSASVTLVTVDIKADRLDDFLKAMEADAVGCRGEAEPGCFRFDLLRDRQDPNRFVFYEVFENEDAVAAHKKTEHYFAWAGFKTSGGVDKQAVSKLENASIGAWAFQS